MTENLQKELNHLKSLRKAYENEIIDFGRIIDDDNKKIQKLESEVTLLKEQNAQLSKDKDSLQKDIEQKKDQITQLEGDKKQSQQDKENLEEKIAGLNSEIAQITAKDKEIETLKVEVESLRNQTGGTSAELVQTQTELDKKKNEVKELEEKNKKLGEEKEELEDKIFDLGRQLSKQKSKSEQEKKELQEKIDDLERKKELVEKQLAENEEKRQELRREMASLDSKITELKMAKSDELDQLTFKNSRLNTDWLAEKDRADKLNRELITLKEESKNSGNSAENADLKKEIEGLKKDSKKQQDAYQQLLSDEQKAGEDLQKQLQTAKEELQNKEEKIQKITEDLTKSQEGLELVKNQVKDLEEKLQNNNSQEDIDSLNSKIKELEQRIKKLEEELAKVEADASKDQQGLLNINATLEQEVKDLKQKIEDLKVDKGVDNETINKAKEAAINSIATLINDSNIERQVITDERLTAELKKKDVDLGGLGSWRDHINNAVSIDEVNGRKDTIEKIIGDLRTKQETVTSLEAAKTAAISDIERVLREKLLEEKDIVADYQEYAKKIRSFADQQAVENFTKEMINYLSRQTAAYQELKDALKRASEVSDEEKDKEEGIFEQRRRIRQTLDNLTELTSPEAQQAYQIMNKDDKIVNCIKELADKIWNYLKENEKKANDPENQEFLKELISRGYTKGTKEYERYWILQKILEEFSQSRLENKKFHFYPYSEIEGADGYTGWRPDKYGKEFKFHVEFKFPELVNFTTFAHEVSHNVVMVKEYKKILPWNQSHSQAFWKSCYIGDDSTFAYLASCLPIEKQRKLKELNNLLIDTEVTDTREVYFTKSGELAGKKRKKKYFEEEKINEEWNPTWLLMLELATSPMNENPENWKGLSKPSEAEKHWCRAEVLHKNIKNKDALADKKKHKIYLFYDEKIASEAFKKSIGDTFSSEKGWEEEVIVGRKAERILARVGEAGISRCGFGKEEVLIEEVQLEQEAQIVVPDK